MRRNLVIGSEGFIGKPFCSFLEKRGEEVVHFDIARSAKEDARSAPLPLEHIDRVYFLAWEVGGSRYLYQEKTQLHQLHWNLELLSHVMKQLEKSKTRFVFVSSQLSEKNTVYGAVKRVGELWTDLIGGVSVRVWNAYGVMEKADIKSHVISDFVYQAVTRKKISMLTDGEEWRQFTHIDDLSRAFYMAANEERLTRTVYDASSYEWIQVKQIAAIIARQTGAVVTGGKKSGVTDSAENKGRIPGWLPEREMEESIARMIAEARKIARTDEK